MNAIYSPVIQSTCSAYKLLLPARAAHRSSPASTLGYQSPIVLTRQQQQPPPKPYTQTPTCFKQDKTILSQFANCLLRSSLYLKASATATLTGGTQTHQDVPLPRCFCITISEHLPLCFNITDLLFESVGAPTLQYWAFLL